MQYPPQILHLSCQLHTQLHIIRHINYEKSDWSRAFNQYTMAYEFDMIIAIYAVDIAFRVCIAFMPPRPFSALKLFQAQRETHNG